MQKFIAVAIIFAAISILIVGRINDWTGHIVFGVIGFIAGLYILVNCFIESEPIHDEATNRFYKPVEDGNNPHHAPCKNCGERARLIYTVYGKRLYGTDCMFCHYTIFFDLWKKEDL